MLILTCLSEGLRMYRRAQRVRAGGFRTYPGDARQICKQIVEDCWNSRHGHFQASAGHFCEFWLRDFAWCVQSLVELGHRERCLKTLAYALNIYSKHNRITTTITPSGKPVDFFSYSPDSLPCLIYCLTILDAKKLVGKYVMFLNSQISNYEKIVVDPGTHLVRRDRYFSSIRDHAKRTSSCYDNVMLSSLAQNLDAFPALHNPFRSVGYPQLLVGHFWAGTHFLDDLSGIRAVTGDANVFPFWTGVVRDREKLMSAVKAMIDAGLAEPFPLRYEKEKVKGRAWFFAHYIAPDYETDTIWTHMGLLFVELLAKLNKRQARAYLKKYTEKIEQYKTFLELYTPGGRPYTSAFYVADEAMLWVANYLRLARVLL